MRVHGYVVDDETRCVHYHTDVDFVAIKFKCCGKFYPCYKCHEESEAHVIKRWDKKEFDEPAILCGKCKTVLTINEYMYSRCCPKCGARFNSRCKAHYYIYFDVPPETSCELKPKQ